MSDTQEIYMQKLQELLCDEDKMITTMYLCSLLNIPVHESRDLMKTYIKDMEKFHNINKTYMLMGVLNDGNGLSLCLTKENELKDKRKLFSDLVSEQIYSIQKSKDSDVISLTYIDTQIIFKENDKFGLVVGSNCIKIENKTVTNVMTSAEEKQEDVCTDSIDKDKIVSSAAIYKQKTQQKYSSSDIKNLFAKMPTKGAVIKTTDSKNIAEKENTNVTNSKQIKNIEAIVSDEQGNEKKSEAKTANRSDKKVQKKNKRHRNDEGDEQVMKRKRIIEQADSDSDDLFGSQEEDLVEDVVISDHEKEPVFKLDEGEVLNNKSKVLKYVSNQFHDGEFLVTKRERVLASDSEEDDVAVVNNKMAVKENEKETITPKSSIQKGNNNKKKTKKETASKQPTLMNFFKKK